MNSILENTIIAVISASVLSLLTLLFASVRSFIFYKRVEYDFTYKRGSGSCEWDVQWEDFRLTIAAESVSNTHISKVVFRRNKRKDTNPEDLEPSDKFLSLFDKEIQVKVNSIVRRQQINDADYILRFVFRRRKAAFFK